MNVKVSVIVPVYNTEAYLEECLKSLVNQTLEDIEIIVINDGSEDGSQAIIEKFSLDYPQKIRSVYKENGGLSSARNLGLKYATGEYLAFVDSDDFVDFTMMETLYNKAQETNSDIVACDYSRLDCQTNTIIKKSNISESPFLGQSVLDSKGLYLLTLRSYVCTKLFRRKLFTDYNFVFPINQHFEDSAVVYNIMGVAKGIAFVNQPFYVYRINREGQITTQYNDKIFDIFLSCQSIIDFYKKNDLFLYLYNAIEDICIFHIFARIEKLRYCENFSLKYRFVTEAFHFLNSHFPDWKHNPSFHRRQKKTKSRFHKIREHYGLLLLFFMLPVRLTKGKQKKNVIHRMPDISKERLRELQLIELDILLHFDAICQKYNLTYYLSEGSLLGAVRHSGFIPWDDDLDVSMPREDYEKFLEIAEKELDTDYCLYSRTTFPQYHLPFSKLVTTRKCGFKNKWGQAVSEKYQGPFIDIFPLDKLPSMHSRKQRIHALILRMVRDMLLFKSHAPIKMSKRRRVYKILSKFCSYKFLQNSIYRISTLYNENPDCKYMANLASSYSQDKQIVPIEAYGTPVRVLFEGVSLPIPCQAHYILTTIYGNYRELPPEKKRVNKHTFIDTLQQNKGAT